MNDAQNWTIILGLLTALWGVLIYLMRGIDARFSALEARFDRLETRFDRLETKLEAWVARIEARIDGLDRDVNILMRRHFGDS